MGKAIGVFETAWWQGDLDPTFILENLSMVSVPAQSIPVRFKDMWGLGDFQWFVLVIICPNSHLQLEKVFSCFAKLIRDFCKDISETSIVL